MGCSPHVKPQKFQRSLGAALARIWRAACWIRCPAAPSRFTKSAFGEMNLFGTASFEIISQWSCASSQSDSDVNEAEIGVGKLREGGSTQVDLATLVEQPFRGAAIGDFHHHAPVAVRDNHLGAAIEEPRRGGELVGIESLAIGHRPAAFLLPIPRGLVSGLTGQAREDEDRRERHRCRHR